MTDRPLVTVICLCYNHQEYVVESLNSVLYQTYSNIQLIIADDCSTDDSKKAIKTWLKDNPEIPFISNEINVGNTKTFNKAFRLAKGDYIIDLAADDVLLPDCVEKQLAAFMNPKLENTAIVYGNVELISEKNEHLGYYYEVDSKKKALTVPASGDIYLNIISQSSKICSVSAMTRRAVLERLGGYDENLAYEDLDVWIRVSRDYHFEFIDAVLVQKRELESSHGSQFYKKLNARTRQINYSSYRVIKKAIALNTSKTEDKALLKRVHNEMEKAYQTYDIVLFLKYVPLELKLRFC